MAAQVEVQTGDVGRAVAGTRLHLSPLTDSSNKSLIEIPSISQAHIIASEPNKPVPSPKPRLTPKPFSVEKNITIKPILAPKPQNKPRPESTRFAGYKPDPPSTPKPTARPVSANPNRPAPTSFRTPNKLNTGQTTKPVAQPFKPAPPLPAGDPTKPTPPAHTERQKPAASNLVHSTSLKRLSAAEWSGTTTKEDEGGQRPHNKGGTSITRAKSMGFLAQIGQEEENKDKVQPEASVPLRPKPRSSRPRPVSAIFPVSPTSPETPAPPPRRKGRPLSADLTSKFESIGLSLHHKSPKENTKEDAPEEKPLPPIREPLKTLKSGTSQSSDGAVGPAFTDQISKKMEDAAVREAEEDKRGTSIRSRISLLLDSSSSLGTVTAGQVSDLPSAEPQAQAPDSPVGVKQLIKQLTVDAAPVQSPVIKPVLKPRPLPLDLTKRFSSERSPDLVSLTEAADRHEISKDPQRGAEESSITPSDQKMFLDLKDSSELPRKPSTPEWLQAGWTNATFKDSCPGADVQSVRASLFENVVERHSVMMMDEGKSANTAKDPLSSLIFSKSAEEDEGTRVTSSLREPASPSSPLRVFHAFDTVQAVEENRVVSESVPAALWEDKAMTLRSRRSEGSRLATERTDPTQAQPASAAVPEPQLRYLRVGALQKWTTTGPDPGAAEAGMPQESQREVPVALEKEREKQRVADQDEVAAAPKRLKMLQTEEQPKPRATYFALTGQMQDPFSPGDTGANFGNTPLVFEDFSVRSALGGSQGKIVSARRNPSLEEALAKTSPSPEQLDELMRSHIPSLEKETKEEMTEFEKKKERKKETERHRTKVNELERERQKYLEMEQQAHLEFARMKEREMQREYERQRQKAFEKDQQEFEEKQRALERQKLLELEKQRLQEFENEKQQKLEKERQEQERKREKELEKEREKKRQKQRDEERQKREKQKMEEMERQKLLEIQKQKQREAERQQLIELERQRLREKERQEAEKFRQIALEQEMLRIKELEKERLKQREMECQREIEREKQKEEEKRLIERERQRLREKKEREEADKLRQIALEQEMLRIKELEKERLKQREMERQKEIEKEKLREEEKQLIEQERQRLREKKEREEADKLRQVAKEQEILRMKELEKERLKQRELEHQKELEKHRALEREKQRRLDIERQKMESQKQKQHEEQEKQRKEDLERIKEMERIQLLEFEKHNRSEGERQQLLDLEKHRLKEKREKEEAEKMRLIAKQQEAERQRLREKQRKEELERLRMESNALRPKVLDLDSVLRSDPSPKPASQRSDPATRWKEPYKPAILDIDSFTSPAQLSPVKDFMPASGLQGPEADLGARLQPASERDVTWKIPSQASGGFSSPVWTASPQDPWELRPFEMSVDKPAAEPRKATSKLNPEPPLLRLEEPLPTPQRHWSAFLEDPHSLSPFPVAEVTSGNPPAGTIGSTPAEPIWIPREPQPPQEGKGESQSHRRSHGSQELNRMRSRSVSRRSAPASSAVDGGLPRMRSRSAHREQDRGSWVQQKQSSEEEGKDSETPVGEPDSQYGTWETGLRTDDSLTPATPSSDGYASPSPRKPTPLHSPGDQASQFEADTLDGPPASSSSGTEPLAFPDAPATLLDTSALRSRAQLGKKRAPRTRPSRAARQTAAQPDGDGVTTEDWLYRDSTTPKAENKDDDSESEEQARGADGGPAVASQPQRIALFPGVDPSALKAQLKKRGDSDNQIEATSLSPSQPSRSPKSPFLPRAARVLPPPGGKENGEEDSPQWLKELKSKKRLSQYENES
ncbi:uncharacterized protein ACNS7B_010727 [Menidia menidia]